MNQDIIVAENSKHSILINDGFIWKLISTDMASALIITATGEVWELHDDGSESLIKSWDQFEETKNYNATYALEGGHICSKYKDFIQSQINSYLKYITESEGEDAAASLLEDFKKIV